MADHTSSNPFRRKTAVAEPPVSSNHNHVAYQQALPLTDASNSSTVVPKKAPKKVRVQSPPPPSPSTSSVPDSTSTVGKDIFTKPTTPTASHQDPFDSSDTESPPNEAGALPKHAPLNPFSRTLETMEHPREGPAPTTTSSISNAGRPAMDVNAFQRLLMTGDAGLNTPSLISQTQHNLEDRGSSTDTSSISRQSLFEPIQETQHESPRTSHEVSDDDHRSATIEQISATSSRKPPPPPSSRHGKLIKVELREEVPPTVALGSPQPPTPSSITSQQYFSASPASNRSATDLNKPLPPAPNRTSHDSDRESIFDKESAGKTPEPPSPAPSLRRKTPPAPPLSRRHSHLVTDTKTVRDTGRLSPKAEEDRNANLGDFDAARRRSIAVGDGILSSGKAPPPPPTRKVGSVRRPNRDLHQNNLASPSVVSLPPIPPPARNSSRSISSGRPASVLSLDMTTTKRTSMAPPPPPPRHGRSSMDGDSTGGEGRRFSGESVRSVRSVRSMQRAPEQQSSVGVGGTDILADIAKLQLEIEAAAKSQSGRNVS